MSTLQNHWFNGTYQLNATTNELNMLVGNTSQIANLTAQIVTKLIATGIFTAQ
jgi:hypothetical protein